MVTLLGPCHWRGSCDNNPFSPLKQGNVSSLTRREPGDERYRARQVVLLHNLGRFAAYIHASASGALAQENTAIRATFQDTACF